LVWIRLESALVRPFGEYKLTRTLCCKGRTSALSKRIQTKPHDIVFQNGPSGETREKIE
jgi:hypothetical protein